MKTTFGVFRRKTIQAGNLEGREPRFEYVLDQSYGIHSDRAGARRALMVTLMPELAGTPDDHIKNHYNAWARNVKAHKVDKLPA